jgi:hypothetical protein
MEDVELGAVVYLETNSWVTIGSDLTGLGYGGVFYWFSWKLHTRMILELMRKFKLTSAS